MSDTAIDTGTPAMRGFERSLPMALMRARESVMQQFRPALAEHDISEQQWRVLRALTTAEAALSVGELAGQTNLLGPSLSRMLVTLERRGLIMRSIDGDDARRYAITPTDDAFDLVAAIAPISEARYRWIERQLGSDDLEQLYRLLQRVAALETT
jgi:homoprotocatechuate degradation regulator HpaR